MREKVIDAVFSYNKLIPPKVISVASNIIVASTSVIEDNFTRCQIQANRRFEKFNNTN